MQLPLAAVLLRILLALSMWSWVESQSIREETVEPKAGHLVGTGIYDMTGPAAQINFMGYAKSTQTAHGIHLRLRSRAFIMAELPDDNDVDLEQQRRSTELAKVEERYLLRWKRRHHPKLTQNTPASMANPDKTVCFVSIDAGMGSDLLTMRVLKRLEELLPEQGSSKKRLCHRDNLSISGTHTHSAPGGFLQYTLFQMTSFGFSEEVMSAYVEGVAQSIQRAYASLQPGTIETAHEFLFESNINRSPSSYMLNPQEERDEYAVEGDTDKTMLMLKFTSDSGSDLGALNWFAVHGTSMNATNQLISGDNKGYASYLMEKHFNGNASLPGQGAFVAAFASTNLGDVSPNTSGPRCLDTGLPCDAITSTCNGKMSLCVAHGPGENMFESTEIIGKLQYDHAVSLYRNATVRLSGEVAFRHSYIDMSNRTVILENGSIGRTCPAALGYSFAAGTTDGPGEFDFSQGTNTSNPFWNLIGGFLSLPTKEQIECHLPKPILLNTGEAKLPYKWDPSSVPISVFQIGQVFILNVPAEFTTMAGRRLRKAVRRILLDNGIEDPIITIAGLANSYTHYVTTFEEYAGQRYEAASTLYGPHTLTAYIQEFQRITRDLVGGAQSISDNPPNDLSDKQLSFLPPVEFDTIGIGKKFGSVAVDAKDEYQIAVDTVLVSFRSANPRNNHRTESTFLTVDMLAEDGSWQSMYVDGDWSTKFIWKGGIGYLGISFAEIVWHIPSDAQQGLYRICHFGTRKTLLGEVGTEFFHAPDWLLANMVGSAAAGYLLQAMRLVATLSHSVQRRLGSLSRSRFKEFSGCSKTFLVRH